MKYVSKGFTISLLCVSLVSSLVNEAHATNSKLELQSVLADLLAWWPGEYDTLPQVELERSLGAPPDGEHDRQYRVFARVKVPQFGENVIYGEVRTGGKDGPLIKGQQVLYIISIDEAHQVVSVSGRRIKDGAQHERAYLYPDKLNGLELDPAYGGNCDFRFQRYGMQLRGWLANRDASAESRTCTMVSKNSAQTMTWDADWAITPQEIWVFDNGYMQDPAHPEKLGRLFAGREDRTYERLYKARAFTCHISPTSGVGNQAVTVLDRGGEIDLSASAGMALKARLLRMPVLVGAPAALVDSLTLATFAANGATPIKQTRLPATARAIALKYQAGTIDCLSVQ